MARAEAAAAKVRWTSGINVVAGLWLIIAPFVLGYAARAAYWNDIILGIVVAALAMMRLRVPLRLPALSWTNVIIGIWLIIAPWILDYGIEEVERTGPDAAATWNDVILGILILVMGAWSAMTAQRAWLR